MGGQLELGHICGFELAIEGGQVGGLEVGPLFEDGGEIFFGGLNGGELSGGGCGVGAIDSTVEAGEGAAGARERGRG